MTTFAEYQTPRQILCADDDTAGVQLTLEGLAQANLGTHVEVVRNGEEALDYLYRRGRYENRAPGNPALVLLDLRMPKISGLEVLRQTRTEPQFATVPVVVFSTSSKESDVVASYELGANAYVVKPVDFAEFLDATRRLGEFWIKCNQIAPQKDPGNTE